MSDFDEEAEREKLREKYEQEQTGREATEQMSELLLKGATMTNAHCSDCGDPIFRYDGQEFCPTCEKPVDRGGEKPDGEAAENGAAGQGNVEVTKPSDDAQVRFGGERAAADERTAGTAQEPVADQTTADQPTAGQSHGDEPSANQPTPNRSATDQSAPEHQSGTEPTRRAPSLDPESSTRIADDLPSEQQSEPERTHQSPSANAGGDVGRTIASARASLARTTVKFARAAEETDDPAMATEYLEAAREAAGALEELD